jgi:xylose isomerase
MLEVLKAGGFTNGGLNFDAKTRRGSYEPADIFHAYIAGMDTFALGLRAADKLLKDGRLDAFVSDRYASYKTGIGADIVSGKATMADLEKYALAMGDVKTNTSGRQEYLENIVNSILFG